jgi:menaquinone-dependent protoporphyrinogen oxidase
MRSSATRPNVGGMKVLVSAASRYGATDEIASLIGNVLTARGFDAYVVPPDAVESIEDYGAVVLGSAVYTGHWLKAARELVERQGDALAARPVWLFSSGPVGDPSRSLVQKMGADPVDLPAIVERTKAADHRMFAGKIETSHLGVAQRLGLKIVRGLEGDFRDRAEIEAWATHIADDLELRG